MLRAGACCSVWPCLACACTRPCAAHSQLCALRPQVAGELVSRFREREEGVKADVFATYGGLLEQVREGSRRYAPQDPNR